MARPWVQLGRDSFERKLRRNNHVAGEVFLPWREIRPPLVPLMERAGVFEKGYRIAQALLGGFLPRM